MPPSLSRTPLAALLAALLAGVPALADEVVLTNGRTFEGVVAELGETEVVIQLPFGELRLPRSRVQEVRRSRSSLEELLRRERALAAADAGAEEWLALARWAAGQGLSHGAREAALRAAALEPRLEGLAPILGRAGYAFDEELGQWVAAGELMRRRGYVLDAGDWITREAYESRERVRREEAERLRREREERRLDRLVRAAELLVVAELQERAESRPPVGLAPIAWTAPVAVFPGFFFPPVHPKIHRPIHGVPDQSAVPPPEESPAGLHRQSRFVAGDDFLARQPGSLIPGVLRLGPPSQPGDGKGRAKGH